MNTKSSTHTLPGQIEPAPRTQRDRAADVIRDLYSRMPPLEDLDDVAVQLATVVEEAQNRPPLGMSDGTLDPAEWEAARDVASATSALRDALLHYSRLTRTSSAHPRADPDLGARVQQLEQAQARQEAELRGLRERLGGLRAFGT